MTARSFERRGGGMGAVIAVLVLVAVLAGLVFAFWGDIKRRFAKPEVVDRPKPAKRVVKREPVEAPPLEVKEKKTKEPRAKPRADDTKALLRKRKAEKLRTEAEAALKALDFKRAAALYNTAAVALEGTEYAAEYEGLGIRAATFGRLTEDLKLNPEAQGENVILHLETGDLECVLVDETPEEYIVERKNGIRAPVPKADVRSIERVGRGDYSKRALAEIEQAERGMEEHSGVAYYLLAERAWKEGLGGTAVDYLEMAYELDGEDLPARVRRYGAGLLLARAHWSESTGRAGSAKMWCMKLESDYPDVTELVEDARELRRRIDERQAAGRKSTIEWERKKKSSKDRRRRPKGRTAPDPIGAADDEELTGAKVAEVRASSGRHAKTIGKMNKLFAKAVDHYVKGRPGNPNSNRHLKLAAKAFGQVVDLCEKVLRDEPRNTAIKDRQAQASRLKYHAIKMQTYSVRR